MIEWITIVVVYNILMQQTVCSPLGMRVVSLIKVTLPSHSSEHSTSGSNEQRTHGDTREQDVRQRYNKKKHIYVNYYALLSICSHMTSTYHTLFAIPSKCERVVITDTQTTLTLPLPRAKVVARDTLWLPTGAVVQGTPARPSNELLIALTNWVYAFTVTWMCLGGEGWDIHCTCYSSRWRWHNACCSWNSKSFWL